MEVLTEVDHDRIRALRERDEFFWLDVRDPSEADLTAAGELLDLHRLALEDTREFGQRAKVDRYPDAILVVFYSARIPSEGPVVELVEVHLHISGGFLFTVLRAPCSGLDDLHAALDEGDTEVEEYILYRVLDALTDALYPVVDHLAQIMNELYRQSDDLGALTSTYFNANANRLNALATRLTVLATFFLIWTLVTSFFGQNFRWLVDRVESLHMFLIFGVGGLVVPTLLAAIYFWRRRSEWL